MSEVTRIQMAPVIDSISDDLDHVGSRLPYPFLVDAKGFVQLQEFWRGHVYRVIGFQNHPAVQKIDLWWLDIKDPSETLGKYLVTADKEGTWSTFPTAVTEAAKVEVTL